MAEDKEENQPQTSEQKRKGMGIRTLPDGKVVQDISFLLDAEEEGLERPTDTLSLISLPELTPGTKHSHPIPPSQMHRRSKLKKSRR